MLNDILKKLNLNFNNLSEEEKKTAAAWQETLDAKPLTLETLRSHILMELDRVNRDLEDYQNDPKKDLYLKAVKRNLQMIADIIVMPERNRERLKNHLKDRFNILI